MNLRNLWDVPFYLECAPRRVFYIEPLCRKGRIVGIWIELLLCCLILFVYIFFQTTKAQKALLPDSHISSKRTIKYEYQYIKKNHINHIFKKIFIILIYTIFALAIFMIKKMIVLADEERCEDFKQVKKCRICKHFTPVEEYLGVCMGKATVYPDLLARTCNDFEWKEK